MWCAVICCSISLFLGLIREEVIFLSLRETKIGDTRCFLRPHSKARVCSRVTGTQSELFAISAPSPPQMYCSVLPHGLESHHMASNPRQVSRLRLPEGTRVPC